MRLETGRTKRFVGATRRVCGLFVCYDKSKGRLIVRDDETVSFSRACRIPRGLGRGTLDEPPLGFLGENVRKAFCKKTQNIRKESCKEFCWNLFNRSAHSARPSDEY